MINIVGIMGSGKTNLSLAIYDQHYRKTHVLYYKQFTSLDDIRYIDDYFESINMDRVSRGFKKAFMIFDDISFLLAGNSKLSREFLNKIANIRHITHLRNIVLCINSHYSKAVLPFLRISQARFLTSITSIEEYEAFSKFYRKAYLSEFMTLYQKDPRPGRFVLTNQLNVHRILVNIPFMLEKYSDVVEAY